MRGRGAAEGCRRERGAPVLLDEDRRVECEGVGQREGYVVVQHSRVEVGALHAYLFHGACGRDLHMLYVDGVGGAGGGIATLCRGHEGHGHDGGERQHAECFLWRCVSWRRGYFQQKAPGVMPT